MSKYYYHGIQGNDFGMKKTLKILTTGGIKCKRLLNQENFVGYNGLDYVSICKKEREVEYFHSKTNGFYSFVRCNFCFIISDTILGELQELKEILRISEVLGIDIVDSSELHFVESYESQKEEGKRIAIKVNL